LQVADTGVGIAPEHLPHIFNPFYPTNLRGLGTGLGRSIADGIVREHDGSLLALSDPTGGARFELVLPLGVPPVNPNT
jgi:signal transduction histidine kinase